MCVAGGNPYSTGGIRYDSGRGREGVCWGWWCLCGWVAEGGAWEEEGAEREHCTMTMCSFPETPRSVCAPPCGEGEGGREAGRGARGYSGHPPSPSLSPTTFIFVPLAWRHHCSKCLCVVVVVVVCLLVCLFVCFFCFFSFFFASPRVLGSFARLCCFVLSVFFCFVFSVVCRFCCFCLFVFCFCLLRGGGGYFGM